MHMRYSTILLIISVYYLIIFVLANETDVIIIMTIVVLCNNLVSWTRDNVTTTCMLCFIVFVTFPCGVLGQVCYLIVSIPDLNLLTLLIVGEYETECLTSCKKSHLYSFSQWLSGIYFECTTILEHFEENTARFPLQLSSNILQKLMKIKYLRKSMWSQELEVRSLNHPYSLKTKGSHCHYVMTPWAFGFEAL